MLWPCLIEKINAIYYRDNLLSLLQHLIQGGTAEQKSEFMDGEILQLKQRERGPDMLTGGP